MPGDIGTEEIAADDTALSDVERPATGDREGPGETGSANWDSPSSARTGTSSSERRREITSRSRVADNSSWRDERSLEIRSDRVADTAPARPEPTTDDSWERPRDAATTDWASDSDSVDWSRDSDTVDWAADSPSDGSDDSWVEAGASEANDLGGADEASSMTSEARIDDLAGRAVSGRLSTDEVRELRVIPSASATYNASRAVLLAHFEASQDFRSHCELAEEAIVQSANLADPQFNLEMGKCHLREGRYNEALETARIAEMHAQDIPSRIRTDRQLKIWEVQAKAYKGMYQATDNLDYVADSIAVWERYRHMARNTYREREIARADREIRGLESLKRGAL
ncbi:MAG TPA: hypothetical protein DIU15_11985 [Deltaproteobacteria bacterium]|nr:hypothetical protein [Deltaproteobacteria bacterium]